jgi:hypothetical protein
MTATTESASDAISRAWPYIVALVALAWTLQLYAIWLPTYVPLLDLPNHMARHYLEYLFLTGRELPPYYEIRYRIVPNLGGDLVVPALLLFFDALTASKLFLTGSVIVFWLGPTVFMLQHSGCFAWALITSLFLLPMNFNVQFMHGYLNSYSGLGLAFLALAHHLWLSKQRNPQSGQLLLHAGLATALFFWHLAARGVYGVILGCHLFAMSIRCWLRDGNLGACIRRAFLLGLPTIPGVAFCALYFVGSGLGNVAEL